MSMFSNSIFKVGVSESMGLHRTYTVAPGAKVPDTTEGSVTFIILSASVLFAGNTETVDGVTRAGRNVVRGRTLVVGDYGQWVLGAELDLNREYTLQGFADLIGSHPCSIPSVRDSNKEPHPWVETLYEAWQTVQAQVKTWKEA